MPRGFRLARIRQIAIHPPTPDSQLRQLSTSVGFCHTRHPLTLTDHRR